MHGSLRRPVAAGCCRKFLPTFGGSDEAQVTELDAYLGPRGRVPGESLLPPARPSLHLPLRLLTVLRFRSARARVEKKNAETLRAVKKHCSHRQGAAAKSSSPTLRDRSLRAHVRTPLGLPRPFPPLRPARPVRHTGSHYSNFKGVLSDKLNNFKVHTCRWSCRCNLNCENASSKVRPSRNGKWWSFFGHDEAFAGASDRSFAPAPRQEAHPFRGGLHSSSAVVG